MVRIQASEHYTRLVQKLEESILLLVLKIILKKVSILEASDHNLENLF